MTRRAVLPERAVVVAGTREEALTGLGALARGESSPAVLTGGPAPAGTGKAVLVFPGQGTQWAGMGRELLDTSPGVRRADRRVRPGAGTLGGLETGGRAAR
ncbi:acyltransferase domain-containing protein [Streptomyces tricolor]|nr:acyltransferase domain-containing protein [Streptomyces tricolor]